MSRPSPRWTAIPGWVEAEPTEEAFERPAGETGDAVRADRRGPDEVDHGPAGDERSAVGGRVRHAGEVLLG